MTKSRKIGIVLAFALLLALFATSIIPLVGLDNSNVADAVTVIPHEQWSNTYSGSYYDNLNTNKIGAEFRSDLLRLISSTHKHETSYDELKTVFKTSDADPNKSGNVIWYYTGDSVPYTGTMDSGNYPTNREHVWPKMGGSAFPEKSQAGSDAHHLRPLNTGLNNTRSNYHFGEVAQTTSNRVAQSGTLSSYGTSDPDTWCYLSGGYFYPAAGYRGATARILFYVEARWGDTSSLSFTLGSGSTKVMSNVDTLLKWHLEEPPTDEEIRRNEVVFGIQGNRNPFIDHPEYAEMIYCNDGKSYNSALQNVVKQYGSYLNGNDNSDKIPTSLTLSQTSINLTVGNTSSKINVTATPSTASNEVVWSSSNTSVATVNNGAVTAVAEGTATITATSKYDSKVTATLSVTVTAVQLTGLEISPNQLTLNKGSGGKLTLTPTPTNAKLQITWSSSNTSVATVDSNGYVTAVGVGTATITAINASPNISATATVTVKEAPTPTKIEVSGTPTKTVYAEGETFDPTGLTVTVTYSDNTTATYSTPEELRSNFQWLDGKTGEAVLSLGTTSITCKFGVTETSISGISVVNHKDNFSQKMAIIESDDYDNLTLQQKFEAISQAVNAYNALTAEEKQQVQGKYTTLLAAAREYNELANAENAPLYEAFTLASNAVVKAIKAMSEVIRAIINAVFGR